MSAVSFITTSADALAAWLRRRDTLDDDDDDKWNKLYEESSGDETTRKRYLLPESKKEKRRRRVAAISEPEKQLLISCKKINIHSLHSLAVFLSSRWNLHGMVESNKIVRIKNHRLA